jgi:hypothetical protein
VGGHDVGAGEGCGGNKAPASEGYGVIQGRTRNNRRAPGARLYVLTAWALPPKPRPVLGTYSRSKLHRWSGSGPPTIAGRGDGIPGVAGWAHTCCRQPDLVVDLRQAGVCRAERRLPDCPSLKTNVWGRATFYMWY